MKVEKQHIDNLVSQLEFKFARVENTTVTGCWAFLPNGFQVAYGESACVDPANYKWEDGCKYAKERCVQSAINKLWELEGYLLKVTGQTSERFVPCTTERQPQADYYPKSHPDMSGFKVYQGKQINRIAYEIKASDVLPVVKGTHESGVLAIEVEGNRYEFVHYEPVNVGDFVCFLDETDIYHVRRSVFEQRNHIK